MGWILNYYPSHGFPPFATPDATPVPRRPKLEEVIHSGRLLMLCDAECDNCGLVIHPPKSGECARCETPGELEDATLRIIKETH